MRKIILIKLGGSLITVKSKPYTANLLAIKSLAQEIYQAKKKAGIDLIIGHGSGSFGHTAASLYQAAKGIVSKKSYQGIAVVQDAAARLNRLVVKELLAAGEKAISISFSSCAVTESNQIKSVFTEPILRFLELGIMPVVYGDVIFDRKKGCCIASTEKILNFLAFHILRKQKNFQILEVVHLGKTNGVYDSKGKAIPKITPSSFPKIKRDIGFSDGIDVTGGMFHKVEESLWLARKGIPSLIINGAKKGNLTRAILGKKVEGTIVTC